MSIRILFLESNSPSMEPLDLAGELRELEQLLPTTKFRDQIELRVAHAVRPSDLISRLRNDRPTVLHFSGHGAADGIVFRREGDTEIPVDGKTLARVLKGRGIKLLVLNACYSASLGPALEGVVPAVVGTSNEVGDQAAILFSRAFYRSLGDGSSIEEAFRDGKDAVVLEQREDVFVAYGQLGQRLCREPPAIARMSWAGVASRFTGYGRAMLGILSVAAVIDAGLGVFVHRAALSSRPLAESFALCLPGSLIMALLLRALVRRATGVKVWSKVMRAVRTIGHLGGRSLLIGLVVAAELQATAAGGQTISGAQPTNGGETGEPPTPERLAYQVAVEKVNSLRTLKTLLDDARESVSLARHDTDLLEAGLAAAQDEVTGARSTAWDASECLQKRSLSIVRSVEEIERFRLAAAESLTQASELGRTPAAFVAMSEEQDAFRRRYAHKRELIARVGELPEMMYDCSSRISAADAAVYRLGLAFSGTVSQARGLVARVDRVRQTAARLNESLAYVEKRHWMSPSVQSRPLIDTPSLPLLIQRVEVLDGMAELGLREPHSDASHDLVEYQDAVLRLVVADDARQFLTALAENAAGTCSPIECASFQERAETQRLAVHWASRLADERRRVVVQSIQQAPSLGIFVSPSPSWGETQSDIARVFAHAKSEVTTTLALADELAVPLAEPVSVALAQALVERNAAFIRVFGFPEPREATDFISAPHLEAGSSAPTTSEQSELTPNLTRHAFEVLTLRGEESRGYGAYTYVIFRDRAPLRSYVALLAAIVDLTPAADPDAPPAVRGSTNLFVLPGLRVEAIQAYAMATYARDIRNYNWERGLSWAFDACSGVLTTPRVLRAFQSSAGPFLLTLPVPLEHATGVTRLLLADLNGYPTSGYKDLLRSYQNELVASFPREQAVWQPPWQQSLALRLVSIGAALGGQYFVALVQ